MKTIFFDPLRHQINIPIIFLIILTFFVTSIEVRAQENKVNYFTEKSYPEHPLISFRENFFGLPVYLIDGQKIKASQVREFMEIIPGDARDFSLANAKVLTGTGLRLGGVGVSASAFIYFLGTDITNQSLTTWFFINLASGVMGTIGQNMSYNGKRQINNHITNYNYLIRQEEIDKPYLLMDNRINLLGEKIDIYAGRTLLDKRQLSNMMNDYPELLAYLEKAQRRQTLSSALDILGLASNLIMVAYIISPQFQSSTPSRLMVPLIGFNIGLGVSSSFVRRSARNHTREALHRFNFNF